MRGFCGIRISRGDRENRGHDGISRVDRCSSGGAVAEYARMRGMRALPTPDAACKSRVHCRRRYREPSFAAAEVSPCGQGKEVGLVNYSTTLTPPLWSDPSRSPFTGWSYNLDYFNWAESWADRLGEDRISFPEEWLLE